ncbi:hypothetical protein K1719_005615 [Acacia pycnantha]|nr:hypothetical protein K1719_005615 [Acacia pycnantha]
MLLRSNKTLCSSWWRKHGSYVGGWWMELQQYFPPDDGLFMTIGSSWSMGHFLLCIYTVIGIAVGFAIATSLPLGTVVWMVMLLSVLGIAFLYALARAILHIRTAVAAEGQHAPEVAAEQPPLDMEQPPPIEEEQPPLDMEQPPPIEEEQPPLDTEQPPPTEEEQLPLDTEQPPPTEEEQPPLNMEQPLTPMVNQLREGDEEA